MASTLAEKRRVRREISPEAVSAGIFAFYAVNDDLFGHIPESVVEHTITEVYAAMVLADLRAE